MILTKDKMKEILSSDHFGLKVYNYLLEVEPNLMGKGGLIAGQAVSSIITELFNLRAKTVINDIDIFINIYEEIKSDRYNKLFKHRNTEYENKLTGSLKLVLTEEYSHVNPEFYTMYSILGTTRDKKINYVFIKHNFRNPKDSLYDESLLNSIIGSFDINSTQVGLYKGKLYFSENFIDYLYSMELSIINWNTPIHSIIRLNKKVKELGVFSNMEMNQNISSMFSSNYLTLLEQKSDEIKLLENSKTKKNVYYAKDAIIRSHFPISIWFGKKFNNLFLNSDLNMNLIEKSDVWFEPTSYELNTLVSKDDSYKENLSKIIFDSNISKMAKDSFTENKVNEYLESIQGERVDIISTSIAALASSNIKHVRKSTIHIMNNAFNSLKKEDYVLRDIFRSFSERGFPDIKDINKFSSGSFVLAKKLFNKHNLLFFKMMNANPGELMNMVEFIYEKKDEDFIGFLEGLDFVAINDMDIAYKKYKTLLENDKLPLVDREPLIISTKEYSIRELISNSELKEEGKEMHHCVGGYGDLVKNGNSIIFSLRKKNTRATLEIRKPIGGEKNFFISQIFGKFNSKINLEDFKELLSIINDTYELLSISEVGYGARYDPVFDEIPF